MTHSPTRDITVQLREMVVPSGGNRYGLVIGIEQYQDSRLNLRCAEADAKAIYKVMTDPDCGMFPKKNVQLLLNSDATRDGIWRALSSLRKCAGENDTVWVYYAGHAAPEESNVYWVTHDSDVDDLYGTGLGNDRISKVLEDLRSKQLLVLLDCCHAAATSAQKNPTRSVLTADKVFSQFTGHGRITMSASDGQEKSIELGDKGHGAFTYYLQKGLRGAADADGDGVVTADELWSYLRSKVSDASRKAGNTQTPVLFGEMRHDYALSLNTEALSEKHELEKFIDSLIGRGEDKLRTGEADACLVILKRTARNVEEEAIIRELKKRVDDNCDVRLLKVLVRAAISKAKSKRKKTSSISVVQESKRTQKLDTQPRTSTYEHFSDIDDQNKEAYLNEGVRTHRGGLILTLGIVGSCCCFPIGIVAWSMGNADLKQMKSGRMDTSGKGTTIAGFILGILSVASTVIIIFGYIIALMLGYRTDVDQITAIQEAFPIGFGISTVLVSMICGSIWWILNNKNKG